MGGSTAEGGVDVSSERSVCGLVWLMLTTRRRFECNNEWRRLRHSSRWQCDARVCDIAVCVRLVTSLISCFCSSVSSILAERAGALVDEADFLYVDDMAEWWEGEER